MAVLRWKSVLGLFLLPAAAFLASCGGGDLATAPSSLVDLQREANLTRTSLAGVWNGELEAEESLSKRAIIFHFRQEQGFSLQGSKLIGESIRIGGSVSRDTFEVVNGVFSEQEVRFNLAPGPDEPLVVSEGAPVLFSGLLSENNYLSGRVSASGRLIGYWQADYRGELPENPGGGE